MKKIIFSFIIGMSTITMLHGTRGLYMSMVFFQQQLKEYEKNPRNFVAQPLEDDESQDSETLEQEQIKQNPTSQQLEQETVSRIEELARKKSRTNLTLLEEKQDARKTCTFRWHNRAKNLTSKL